MSTLDDKARQEILALLDAEVGKAVDVAFNATIDKAIADLDEENSSSN